MIDVATVSIIGSAWNSVAEEMGEAMVRTSLSPNIKERRDCSAVVFSRNGELLAQAAHIPAQLGSTMGFVKHLVDSNCLREGDVWVYNDPYEFAGAHPNDIAVAEGTFYEGELVGISATIAHHLDVGGRVGGSEAPDSTDVLHDGFRIPPVRLVRNGEAATDIWDILSANTRLPLHVDADLKAQIAACRVGSLRQRELCVRYGTRVIAESTSRWLDYGRQRYEEAARDLAGTRYSFEVVGDDDGLGGEGAVVRGDVSIEPRQVIVDLRRSGPQVPGGINSPMGSTMASVYFAIKAALDPTAPNNEGFYGCVQVLTKPGTIVDPVWPAAVGHRVTTIHDIAEGILRGLAETGAETGLAGCAGPSVFIISGETGGQRFVDYEVFPGGIGASGNADGLDGCQSHITNSSNLPVEVLEQEYPLMITRYERLRGSGGAGAHRGGDGVLRELVCLAEQCVVTVGLKNGLEAPRGVQGGSDGRRARAWKVGASGEQEIFAGRTSNVPLQKGDRVIVESAGGGGWGMRD